MLPGIGSGHSIGQTTGGEAADAACLTPPPISAILQVPEWFGGPSWGNL